MRIIHILFIPIIIALLCSCNSSKQVCYFQDMQPGVKETIISPQEIKIQPEDKISWSTAKTLNWPIYSTCQL